MACRGVRPRAVHIALTFGRVVRTRGADIYAVGRKEVERYAREGIDLESYEGTQVVVGLNGRIVTVYRNSDFRGLRPRYPARRRSAA